MTTTPNPSNVSFIVDKQPINADALTGIRLPALNDLLTELDRELALDKDLRRSFTARIREVARQRLKGASKTVTIDVTSSLDPKEKKRIVGEGGTFLRMEGSYAVFSFPSGSYRLKTRL